MATDLGKVGIVMKGNWSNSATYEVLDAVTYNNALYIAKQAVPANTTPTNTTYWQKSLAQTTTKTSLTADYATSAITSVSGAILETGNITTITASISFTALSANDELFDLSSILNYTVANAIYFSGFNSSGNFFKFRLDTDRKIKSYGANSASNYVAFTITFAHE